jgi:DNA-binding NarL/FixJ family response regulator
MKYHRFEEVNVLVADSMPASRDIIKNCLSDIGIRKISFCEDIAQTRDHVENHQVDLLICDAYLAEKESAQLIRELRDMQQKGDPFLPIVTLTWQPTIEVIHSIVNAGTDLILTLPMSVGKLRNAVEVLIERRKPFVVTSTYIGPDRRKEARPDAEEVPQINVPNPLRYQVTGDDGGVNGNDVMKTIREQRVERSAARITHTVGALVSTAKVRNSVDIGRLISELQFTANDLHDRIGDTRYAHQRALSESILDVATRIAETGNIDESDLELLPQLALALELAMGHDDENSVEAALDISRALRKLPTAAE